MRCDMVEFEYTDDICSAAPVPALRQQSHDPCKNVLVRREALCKQLSPDSDQ